MTSDDAMDGEAGEGGRPRGSRLGGRRKAARPTERRERPAPKPLDAAKLEERAIAYVARFATSRGKLTTFLNRKLAERGWAGDDPPPVAALVDRLCAAGYVDDAAYARAKSGSLLRRGFGNRRVAQALGAAGIDADLRQDVAAGEGAARRAALTLARKRRFGPFDREVPDRPRREKQVAAMLRAGHALAAARALTDAATIAEAEAWAYGADDDDSGDDDTA